MSQLLMHSIVEFAEIVFSALEISGAKKIVEVGSESGTMTSRLLDHTKRIGGRLTSIDTSPTPEVERLFAESDHAELLRGRSLDLLPSLTADAYIVDGDHNYYTVLHESELIWEQARSTENDLLVFYHDVCWPWARRDLYYDPDSIPKESRHPHTWKRGVTLGVSETIDGGFRGEGVWACALKEGGAKNGVLTAIEDFVEGKEAHLCWARVPAVFGLGVLFSKSASWADAMASLLLPLNENPLIARLERNRLECYLNVIAWQDRFNECEVDV